MSRPKHLNLTKGACLTEKVMIILVDKGIGRQEGHEILRKAAIQARNENRFMYEILIENENIKDKFSKAELKDLLDPHTYIGKAVEQVENLTKNLKSKYNLK